MLRRFAIVGALFLGVGVAVMIGALHAQLPQCSSDIIQEAVSPDGRYRASVSEGSCGATTGVTTYVTLERNFYTFLAKTGDVLIADGDRIRLGANVQWSGPRDLVISWRGSEEVFLAEGKVLGVSVEYVDP